MFWSTPQYIAACHLLWCALSAFYEFADLAPQPFTMGYQTWDDLCEPLAEWLSNETKAIFKKQTASEAKRTEASFSRLENAIIPRWVLALQSASANAHDKYQAISSGEWLYCHYCVFIAKVIREFEGLMGEFPEASYASVRQANHSVLLAKLANVFVQESRIIMREGLATKASEEALSDLEAFGVRAANDWKQSVLAAAKDLAERIP